MAKLLVAGGIFISVSYEMKIAPAKTLEGLSASLVQAMSLGRS
jgi:hypothetical protein